MRSSEKCGKNKALQLETDLLLSQEDLVVMKKPVPQERQDLEGYLDFLEDIGAFETKKIKTKFYDAEFEL